MKKTFYWCKLFFKRHLKRPSMIIILALMILIATALRLMSTDITASISVGFYIDEYSDDYEKISGLKDTLQNHEGILEFVFYDTRENLELAVRAGKFSCGYAFSSDFYTRLENEDSRNTIELISPPENSISILSNLIIIASIMENTAGELLIDDSKSLEIFSNVPEEDFEKLFEEYKKFASNGSTFSFDYDALYDDYTGSDQTINIFSYLVTPVKGIVAIFIFITALTGGVTWYRDKQSFTYSNIPIYRRPLLKLLSIFTPTFIATFVGFLSLFVAGVYESIGHELYVIVVYGLICIIFTYILSTIVSENIFLALIPVFILGSVICCPIFFNLANLIPAMKILQNIFVPTYFFIL